jgi:hypothetical protein
MIMVGERNSMREICPTPPSEEVEIIKIINSP